MTENRTYTAPMDAETYRELGLDQTPPWEVNGRSRYEGVRSASGEFDKAYTPCQEAYPGEDVPKGRMQSVKDWQASKTYPGTVRDLRFFVTADVAEGQTDLNLMIFNDGHFYIGREGAVRATNVLDSLSAVGEIPPTLAIFVNPGRPVGIPAVSEQQTDRNAADDQRSIEYDSLRPEYGQFLLQELIPMAEEATGCRVTDDPSRRMLIGISSGGICAFTAAWHNPDSFGLVLSHCGSFTNIKGGHNYPWMIRNTPRKPIRVFMTSGENDIDGLFGNWPLANKQVASALAFAGYDYRFEFGTGGHNLAHGGSLFADSLRWLLNP